MDRKNDRFTVMMNDEKIFDDGDGEVKIIMSSVHMEGKNEVECEGMCVCYDELLGDGKRSGSLVYSSRYSGMVIVSLLGFAVAKFVDNRIDECYNEARIVLGENEDDVLLTCAMENVKCEEKVETYAEKMRKIPKEERVWRYECNGYCMTNRKIKYPPALFEAEKMECNEQRHGKEIIDVTFDDSYKYEVIQKKKVHRLYEDTMFWHRTAKMVYMTKFLKGFCASFTISYWYHRPNRTYRRWKTAHPCVSSRKIGDLRNIECKRLKRHEDYE